MKTSHQEMQISESDWSAFLEHLDATLDAFRVPEGEHDAVVAFVQSTRSDIVESSRRPRLGDALPNNFMWSAERRPDVVVSC